MNISRDINRLAVFVAVFAILSGGFSRPALAAAVSESRVSIPGFTVKSIRPDQLNVEGIRATRILCPLTEEHLVPHLAQMATEIFTENTAIEGLSAIVLMRLTGPKVDEVVAAPSVIMAPWNLSVTVGILNIDSPNGSKTVKTHFGKKAQPVLVELRRIVWQIYSSWGERRDGGHEGIFLDSYDTPQPAGEQLNRKL